MPVWFLVRQAKSIHKSVDLLPSCTAMKVRRRISGRAITPNGLNNVHRTRDRATSDSPAPAPIRSLLERNDVPGSSEKDNLFRPHPLIDVSFKVEPCALKRKDCTRLREASVQTSGGAGGRKEQRARSVPHRTEDCILLSREDLGVVSTGTLGVTVLLKGQVDLHDRGEQDQRLPHWAGLGEGSDPISLQVDQAW